MNVQKPNEDKNIVQLFKDQIWNILTVKNLKKKKWVVNGANDSNLLVVMFNPRNFNLAITPKLAIFLQLNINPKWLLSF